MILLKLKNCLFTSACCIAGLSVATAYAQTAGDLGTKILNEGQWTFAYRLRPGLLGTNGYDVVYDERTLIKLGYQTYAINFAKTNATKELWIEPFHNGTYKVDCNRSEFYFIGYKFIDGSWVEGRPGIVRAFGKENRSFFGKFCSEADSLLAAREAPREAAIKAAAPPPAQDPANEQPDVKVAPVAPNRAPKSAAAATSKPASAPQSVPATDERVRVYNAGGITVRCVTENGRRVCR